MVIKGDALFVDYLQKFGYHPRSDKHSDEICNLILNDLFQNCPDFRAAGQEGRIVYKLNHTIFEGTPYRWNIDLVVGPPMHKDQQKVLIGGIAIGQPSEIWVAIDAKSIMTEHGKARRNRQRDLNALQDLLHRENEQTIVGGFVAINIAPRFRSPLRSDITIHTNIERLVGETVEIIEQNLGDPHAGKVGLDALGIIVVNHTNIEGDTTELIKTPPAPSITDRTHYQTFIAEICRLFSERYSSY